MIGGHEYRADIKGTNLPFEPFGVTNVDGNTHVCIAERFVEFLEVHPTCRTI